MQDVIIMLVLFFFCSGIIYIIVRKNKTSLSWLQIMVFFSCKIAAGAVYGYIFKKYYTGDDTWGLNHDSLAQYNRLTHSPRIFFTEIFTKHPYPPGQEFYFGPEKYLEGLEFSLLTKVMAPFNSISHGNYYINTIFFNFFTFWGVYFLYKLLAEECSTDNKILVFVLFLFPPAAFWLSGIRADGFILLFSSILLYKFNQWLTKKKITDAVICMLSFTLLYIFRDGFALLFIPALTGWWLITTYGLKPQRAFGYVYATAAILVTCSIFLPQPFNLLQMVAKRQHEFLTLKGNTKFNLTPLTGDVASFFKTIPEALLNTFIRPFFWEAKGILQWFFCFENLLILLLAAISIFRFNRYIKPILYHPMLWVLVCTGLSAYLLTGITVPFPGAIARYKIIPELFLLSVLLIGIKRQKQVSL